MMKSKNSIICFCFLCYFIINSYIQYYYLENADHWVFGDWLINYADGFVRRGLSGEFFLLFDNVINPINLLFIVKLFFYAVLSYTTARILIKSSYISSYYYLLASPALFLFITDVPRASGRKELIFFSMLSFLVWRYINGTRINYKIILTCLFPLAILCHEVLFTTLPFILFMWTRQDRPKIHSLVIMSTPSVIAFLLCLIYREASYQLMMSRLLEHEVILSPGGALLSLSKSSSYYFNASVDLLGAIPFIIYIPLSLVGFYFIRHKFYNLNKVEYALLLLPVLLLFALSFVAIDWGRWINIYITGLFFISFSINEKTQPINMSKYHIVLIFIYMTFWALPLYPSSSEISQIAMYIMPNLE
ncbi:hypothetical protein A9264_08450 [Vibrio sp. UCD-FRSSP16_10]|uniref:hypothetical protein n=1 Tax=unclassified Vibrio TaxID=2614977 RepID=UPI0008021687|nr:MULTISPECIES: hypothetical protein [unclassified Vibrio]OBT06594.1 hypothetical protein A9260_09235 [Vibrio sp. UCD-FRSSP16_30]OBT12291.1 hypothetical protein A9264_08450 [Vibrio sp. UCD-FRSSP16_10]